MRPPYLISTLDKAKDVTLQEMIKDSALRDRLLKLKEEVLFQGQLNKSQILHNNYSLQISPLFELQRSDVPMGFMLIVTTSHKNNIKSFYEQTLKNKADVVSLELDVDDDLPASLDKVMRLCREQFALSYERIRDIVSGKKELNKVSSSQAQIVFDKNMKNSIIGQYLPEEVEYSERRRSRKRNNSIFGAEHSDVAVCQLVVVTHEQRREERHANERHARQLKWIGCKKEAQHE